MAKDAKEDLTFKAIVDAGKDMNKVMGLDPKIKTAGVKREALIKAISKEAKLAYQEDKFKGTTWFVLESLGIARASLEHDKEVAKKDWYKEPKAAAGKKNGGKKASAKKAAAKKDTPAKKKAAAKTKGQPSNKEQIWKAWKNGKGTTDPEKLNKLVKGAVKINTIKVWVKAWANGKSLPGCAKK